MASQALCGRVYQVGCDSVYPRGAERRMSAELTGGPGAGQGVISSFLPDWMDGYRKKKGVWIMSELNEKDLEGVSGGMGDDNANFTVCPRCGKQTFKILSGGMGICTNTDGGCEYSKGAVSEL